MELIHHAAAGGIDVSQLTVEHEGADDEVVVWMHIVAATGAMKDFVAEDANRAEAGASALIVVKVEAGFARNETVGVSRDVRGAAAVGADKIVPTIIRAQDE